MDHTIAIFELIGGFLAAETPLFMLVLHLSARIVRLETTIELLITHIPTKGQSL